MRLIIMLIVLAATLSSDAASLEEDTTTILPVIPKPTSLHRRAGTFEVIPDVSIRYTASDLAPEAFYLGDCLGGYYHLSPQIRQSSDTTEHGITLVLSKDDAHHAESYTLRIDNEHVIIEGDRAGVFYGVQTLLQILPVRSSGKLMIPALEIEDFPRFRWRGMHLDVSRHFFPVEFIKKYIDLIAMYKMNVFHWHLTDDQGWRIEIKKYPKLTQIGAYRNGSMVGPFDAQKFDSIRYGGFYTQDEIRGIVDYAAGRHVTIVPEIEMPGHSVAALASYPELSCTGGQFEVGKAWGVYEDVFCTKEETFNFLEDVLSEVCNLFPGKYIHVGGDEVPKDRWKKCPVCQAVIQREHLKDENELESYFIERIEKFLNKKGKQIIGWDEILEGGLAPNAAVMSWRGIQGGVAAARLKHSVVMTPGGYCYFDYYQGSPQFEPLAIGGYTPIDRVYSYEPVPSELTPGEEGCIMGAQGNVWTEYITTPEQVEYMVLPRMAALAEVDWTPKANRDYNDFVRRLSAHFALLNRMEVNYSRAVYEIKTSVSRAPDGAGVLLRLSTPFDSSGIRYTTDGSEVSAASSTYREPIRITQSGVVKFCYLQNAQILGNRMEQSFSISKATGKPIVLKTPPHENYPGSGAFTLVDGVRGDSNRFIQNWIGFWGPDLDAVIDLGKVEEFSKITIGFFNAPASWIYPPKSIVISVSDDSTNWTSIKRMFLSDTNRLGHDAVIQLGERVGRFIRVVAENAGKIREGNPGAGEDSWLFVDEILVE